MILSEDVFKALFIIVFIPFLIIWIFSFLRSGLKRKSFYSKHEGMFMAILFRVILTFSLICILVYLVNPEYISWANIRISQWIRLAGFILGLISLILIFWCLRSLGRNFHASLTLRDNHQLITSGLYRWSRHPLYVLFNLIWICFFLMTTNILIGISGVLVYLIIYIDRVPREEAMMADFYGKQYMDYMKVTGRYLPKLDCRNNKNAANKK